MKASILSLQLVALFGMHAKAASSSASTQTAPAAWKGATVYPTTVTRIWSRTLTAKASETPSGTATADTGIVTIQTVTMYEPWPSSPNPANFPYTMLQTAITSRDLYSAHVDASGRLAPTGSSLTATPVEPRTVTSTWVLWDTSPTDLAAGQALPACDRTNDRNDLKCATPNLKQDTRCIEHGLTTACHSQCKIRRVEGWDLWWCHKRGDGTSKLGKSGGGNDTREVAIGRVCTDSMGYYEQLLEPCDTMDHGHDCLPCNG